MQSRPPAHKKILVLATDVFSKGGIQRYTRYQVKALRETPDTEVTLLSLWGKDQSNTFEEDFAVDYIGTGVGFLSKLKFFAAAWHAARAKKINLVICNHVALAQVAFALKVLLGIPYAVNVYGLEIWNGLTSFKLKALRRARLVIGDCNFILKYVVSNLAIPPERTALLYDCVDITTFRPQPVPKELFERYAIPQDKFRLLAIGRLVYDKGQKTVIEIMKDLPKEIVFVIAGGGAAREKWEALAKNEGIADRVIFTGRIAEEELIPMYNAGDVFIYLSEFKPHEGGGLPLTSIEAAACEKPVLTSNEDGAAEAVAHGKTGLVMAPRDHKAIVDGILTLFNDAALRSAMGKAAREYVTAEFAYEKFKTTQTAILDTIGIARE